jgi:hypothetical protein
MEFKNLEFKAREFGVVAQYTFDNGITISVVAGEVNNMDLDNAVYRLENVYKYLDIEYKETGRGEKYVQINYIPVTSPQSQQAEFVNVRYNSL